MRVKAIGANGLFCRVAAFYHDIGKIRKPEYYIENQRGVNPHDRLKRLAATRGWRVEDWG